MGEEEKGRGIRQVTNRQETKEEGKRQDTKDKTNK